MKPFVIRTPILFIVLFSCTFFVRAQNIQELEIIPNAPITSEDEVSVIASAWHPTQGCPIVETDFFYNQDTITVVVEHELGVATAICNSVDTTSLGSYAPGTYTVEYVMISGVFGTPAATDTAYIEFTVEIVSSIGGTKEKSILNIYPNPGSGNLFIETDWRGQVGLYNLMGRELDNFSINKSPFSFSTQNLSAGVHLLVPAGDGEIEGVKFIVNK